MEPTQRNVKASYVGNPARVNWRGDGPSAPALAWHRALPNYTRTPLVNLETVAAEFGFDRVWAKDETSRFGLGSFKILGATWAVEHALQGREVAKSPAAQVLIAASDGNHGLAIAAVARSKAMRAEVLVPRETPAERIRAIECEGGIVRLIDGGYDDAVRAAARRAAELGPAGLLVSDTALGADDAVPRLIADGYLTLFAEIADALEEQHEPPPDLVLLPVGVGGLASAGVRWFRCAAGVRLVAVEPLSAACAHASIAAGRPMTVAGNFDSTMVGLNAGTPSLTAWPDLLNGLDGALAISDAEIPAARWELGAAGISAGDTGVAGLAGLRTLVSLHHADASLVPFLAEVRRVLVLVTEGETPKRG